MSAEYGNSKYQQWRQIYRQQQVHVTLAWSYSNYNPTFIASYQWHLDKVTCIHHIISCFTHYTHF